MRPGQVVPSVGAGSATFIEEPDQIAAYGELLPDTVSGSDQHRTPVYDNASATVADRRVILPQKGFGFILRWALRHAVRYSDYLTLVTIRANREYVGSTIDVGSQALAEIAEVIGPTIRSTDLFGELEAGRLGLLLSDADHEAAFRIIQRFADTLGQVRFSIAMAFAIGVASCPKDGVEAAGVVAHAMMHPILDIRAGPALPAATCLSC
jgi:hypothetical protein